MISGDVKRLWFDEIWREYDLMVKRECKKSEWWVENVEKNMISGDGMRL